ncbi:OmpH family outer membrane protein [Tamlana sp. 2_MG-2023]|uniref:OmpH family outer membrane protein n=1 Tax=unclassified Tamlana TaxID=2614803 RepID=UPI0026E164A2|nr:MULTISPECIES: OmpH family outer membrane protein [unclassified Tamlana]MDO6759656.1 OmpH family outer membrane protein [Tamlana sp. 2_MG-2023]MDO6791279.1 OmpH family outer membrane protein [Tamlana sp. 1_MG-2023]
MKNIFYVVLLAIAFTSCQQQKIGFVDNGTVINEFQEKKDIEANFQVKDEAFKKRADSIGQAFQAEVQEAQAVAQKTPQKAQEIMGGLQQKQQMLQQQMQIEQQAITQEFQTQIDSVIVKVKDFVNDYGKKNGYTFVLGTSDASASVLYGAEESDLTQTVLEALNADYTKE